MEREKKLKEEKMFKRIALITILFALLITGSLVAQYTLDIYTTVHCITTADVNVGYLSSGDPEEVHHYDYVENGTVIHTIIPVGPGNPPPDRVFAEGKDNVNPGYDYDEEDVSLYYPMYLELWIGVKPDDDGTTPSEE